MEESKLAPSVIQSALTPFAPDTADVTGTFNVKFLPFCTGIIP